MHDILVQLSVEKLKPVILNTSEPIWIFNCACYSIQIKHNCIATEFLRAYLLIKVSFSLPVPGSLPALLRCAHHSLPKARPCSVCILPMPTGVEAVVTIGNTLTRVCLILLSRTSNRSTWTLCMTEQPTWLGHNIRGFLLPI